MQKIDKQPGDDKTVLHELAAMLTTSPAESLRRHRADLIRTADTGERALTRRIAFAAWIMADGGIDGDQYAEDNSQIRMEDRRNRRFEIAAFAGFTS